MMGGFDREYPYQPGWLTIVSCGLLFAACTVGLAYIAQTHQRGIVFFRVLTLSPGEAKVFLWLLAACSAGFVLICLALIWHRLFFRQRLALTATGITLPAGRWSRKQQTIAYTDIYSLEALQVQGQRFLHIHHTGGKHTLTAAMLPSKAAFDEACGAIAAKLEGQTNAGPTV